MDDPVCTSQRCTRRSRQRGGGGCRVGGGHGWSGVIDLSGHTSPGDKDTQRNRDVVEEALTDGGREDRREAVSEWRLRTTARITAEVDDE